MCNYLVYTYKISIHLTGNIKSVFFSINSYNLFILTQLVCKKIKRSVIFTTQ